METFLTVLTFIALFCSLALAWLVYESFRLLFGWFRMKSWPEGVKLPLALRLPDRVLAVLCVLAFLGLVL